MKLRWWIIFQLFLMIFFSYNIVDAGMMSYRFPKRYILSGLAELTYEDFETTSSTDDYTTTRKRTDLTQRYTLGLSGYVYDPRLVVFSAKWTYRHGKVRELDNRETVNTSSNVNYNLSATFLPYRPISLSVYRNKTHSTVEGTYIPQFGVSSTSYGADLRANLRRFPLIRLGYHHWKFHSELVKGVTTRDSYEMDIWGNVRALRTRYIINADITRYKTPQREIDSREIRGYSDSVIKKGIELRSNSYYSKVNLSRYYGITLDLEINPLSRFGQDYSSSLRHSETDSTRTDTYRLRGTWSYRFNEYLSSRFSLSAGFSEWELETNTEETTSYSVGGGLSYHRRIAGFDTRSFYRGSYTNKEKTTEDGKILENPMIHNAGTSISRRIFSFATVFTGYDILYIESEERDSITHSLRLGMRGKGPKRAYWRLEGGYRDSRGSGIMVAPDIGAEGEGHGITYTTRAEIGYPIRYKGLVTLNSGYEKSRLDGDERDYLYYESRINYLITKDLSARAWWREGITRDGINDTETKTRDITISGIYRFKRVFLTVEYKLWQIEEDSDLSKTRRILLKITRVL